MPRQRKKSVLDFKLEAWGAEPDEEILDSTPNTIFPHPIIQQQQRKPTVKQQTMKDRKRVQVNRSPQQKDSKIKGINFIKKNQEQLKSHTYLASDFATVLKEDLPVFSPLGYKMQVPNFFKRPVIHTTFIGYYDKNPLERVRDSKKNSSHTRIAQSSNDSYVEKSSRPKTTQYKKYNNNHTPQHSPKHTSNHSHTKLEWPNSSRENSREKSEYWYQTINGGVERLQKVLKMKEKLRLKLKKNSEQRDIERGIYSKETMKIEEPIIQSSSEREPKTRSSMRKGGSPGMTKWKDYMKFKEQEREQTKNKNKNNKRDSEFYAVVGGASHL